MFAKSKILELYKKRNICCKATYKQHTYQISKQYLYIWLCDGKKTVKSDDVTFSMRFIIDVRKNKSYFWNPEKKKTG